MSLPSSGSISYGNIRTEMSQSGVSNYSAGGFEWGDEYSTPWYAPVNVGSAPWVNRTTKLDHLNFSASYWYNYNHLAATDASTGTASLFQHADSTQWCFPSSMVALDMGTSNQTITINLSGSHACYGGNVEVWYGKPWSVNGNSGSANFNATFITGFYGCDVTQSFSYSYIYDASKGTNLYFVLLNECP